MFKFLIKLLEYFLKKDIPFVFNESYKQNLELYKLHNKQAHYHYKQIRKEYLKNLLIHHKYKIMRLGITSCIVFIAFYFSFSNFYPKIIRVFTSENLEATINNDSTVIIRNVINPHLTLYLDAIAATETTIKDINHNKIRKR